MFQMSSNITKRDALSFIVRTLEYLASTGHRKPIFTKYKILYDCIY